MPPASSTTDASFPHCHCLRCANAVTLRPVDGAASGSGEIHFFECPECHRHYAQLPGRALTFRWPHPVSLALYGFRGESGHDLDIAVHCIAASLTKNRDPEEIDALSQEIALEIEHPTQRVRDILDTPAPEEACRDLLRRVVAALPRTRRDRIRANSEADRLARLTPPEQAAFLATLAHALTIHARGTYQPRSHDVAQPYALRRINEVQHRITACLRDCVAGECNESFLRSLPQWVFDEADETTRELLLGAWQDACNRTSG